MLGGATDAAEKLEMPKETLTITDNRTGQTYELPIVDGSVHAADLARIRVSPEEPGLVSYDPALRNTATCRSAVTYQDGVKGILWYGGYPIEDLAQRSTYLEVAYLIFHGRLPNAAELASWQAQIAENYLIHTKLSHFFDGFRHDAHPMGVLVSGVAALSTLFPEAAQIHDAGVRYRQVLRLLGQVPSLAAFAHRRRIGLPYAYPNPRLSYVGNFLSQMFTMTELAYEPDPTVERALDVLFILHADHGQACSTTTMRCVGSAKTDPYCAAAAAAAALYGRFHDEGFESVLDMLGAIGTSDNVPAYLADVRTKEIEPPGFGHRLYKTYDPRARILRSLAEDLFKKLPRPALLDVALRLDDDACKDSYFVEHSLYPIVDFYEAVIYDGIGFPRELFPVLFAIPRFVGWLAQWEEMMRDPGSRTFRPRQIYSGPARRQYVPIERRG
jgi:citrate synthase